jgi:modification methylase
MNASTPSWFTSEPWSVWDTAQADAHRQRKGRYVPDSMRHPGKMLPAIAAHAIAFYTRPDELVLDPMCGTGTTLVEAIHQQRHAIGIEYEPRWAHLARTNIEHAQEQGAAGSAVVVRGDARELPGLVGGDVAGRVALLVTSPPYGPATHGQVSSSDQTGHPGVHKWDYTYSRSRANLAYRPHRQLLEGFGQILAGCARLLRPGGFVVITARAYRDRGTLVDLPSEIIDAGAQAGLHLHERGVALLAGLRDGRLVPRPSFFQLHNVTDARETGLPLHLIAHEDVLVFRALPGDANSQAERPSPRYAGADAPRQDHDTGAAA